MSIRRVRRAALATATGVVLLATAPLTVAGHAATATAGACTATWDQQDVPEVPGARDNTLLSITGTSSSSLYATGQWFPNPSQGYSGRVLRNSGSGWTELTLPDRPQMNSDFVFLTSSTAPGPDEAWVGGSASDPDVVFEPILLHVVGSTVTAVALPSPPAGYGELDSDGGLPMDTTGGTDLWVAGSYYPSDYNGAHRSVLYRPKSGGGWTQTIIPTQAVTSVDAVSSTTAYIGGQGLFRVSAGTVSPVPLPGDPPYIRDITSTGSADVWVLAATATGKQSLLHYDGSSWSAVALPSTGLPEASVDDIAVTVNGVLWVTGTWTDYAITHTEQRWVGRFHPASGTWAAGPASADTPTQAQSGYAGGLSDLLALSGGDVYVAGWGVGSESVIARQCHLSVDGSGLTPSAVRVKARGDAVLVVADGGTSSARITDTTGLLSVPPLSAGEGATLRPDAAGTYRLASSSGGSGATLGVPVQPLNGPRRAVTVYVASSPAPAGYSYQLQALTPGATTWRSVGLTASTGGTAKIFHPAQFGPGTYSVRARVTNTTTGISSGWSPTVQFTLPAGA